MSKVRIEPVIGRYMHLDIIGKPHRVYWEEAGPPDGHDSIPLVCLHTAGADGRQYRALLNDAEITANFRVIAFDFPARGGNLGLGGGISDNWEFSIPFMEILVSVASPLTTLPLAHSCVSIA